jgi:hypothetical protein
MNLNTAYRQFGAFILIVPVLISCSSASVEPESSTNLEPTQNSRLQPPSTDAHVPQPSQTPDLMEYTFPESIDPEKRYLFYLHGKIIEDQGILAFSPDFGEYEYGSILETLSGYGFVVISEQRPKDTDGVDYARKISGQVTKLIEAGIPMNNITVVGASKGAAIAIFVSHFLDSEELNFVLMGICHPDYVEVLIQDKIFLHGNVLSIYDSVDEFAGSCQELFSFSDGKGISSYDEIVLDIGSGHGILYQPLEAWLLPAIQWANPASE